MPAASFPFPARNPTFPNPDDIICVPVELSDDPALFRRLYERAHSEEAKVFKMQYWSIEAELVHSFQYVSPASDNGKTHSIKFAEVIKNAANVFELLGRMLYQKFYNDRDKININNFLALDYWVKFAGQRIRPHATFDGFHAFPEVKEPFLKLAAWNQRSAVDGAHVPDWWRAYNDIKHSNSGLKSSATLANAIAAVGAIFVLIGKVYGFWVVGGGVEMDPTGTLFLTVPSRLFSIVP